MTCSTWRRRCGSALVVLGLSACAATDSAGRSQHVRWFRSGPFAGVSAGIADAEGSASELDADLAALGHTTMSTLDDTDNGWKVYAGYRFEKPFAIEAGYVELGQVSSTIRVTAPVVTGFLDDVAEVHPFLGRGPFLAGQFSVYDEGPVELGVRLGVWSWDAEVESKAASIGDIDIDERRVDPLLGFVFLVELARWLEVRLEYEKYYLDDQDADVVSAGLQGKLLR